MSAEAKSYPDKKKPKKKFAVESSGVVFTECDSQEEAEAIASDLEKLSADGVEVEGTIDLSEEASNALEKSTAIAKSTLAEIPLFLPHALGLELPAAAKTIISKTAGAVFGLVQELGRVVHQDANGSEGGASFVSKAGSLRQHLNVLAPELEGCELAAPVNKAIDALSVFEVVALDHSLGLIKKRGIASDPEGGIHVHTLERENEVTKKDGAHPHLFLLSDGRMVVTAEDGEHEHALDDSAANDTAKDVDGQHIHKITIDEDELETGEGVSAHRHELMVETTTFGGVHVHTLEHDGETISSLTPGQFWALIGEPEQADNDPSDPATQILRDQVPESVQKVLSKRMKIRKTDEERFVLGIVLEPNDGGEVETPAGEGVAPFDPDTQKDIYSAADIRETAHQFMADFQNIGLMHTELINGDVAILESYIAPVDFEIDGEMVHKGTWLLAIRIKSDDLWSDIKAGKLGAYSIGGDARRVPLSDA